MVELGAAAREPDVFTQMPITKTTKVERLRYMTDPLSHDVTVAGPITLTLHAAIDQDDTNWIVVLKDVGPDVSVMSVREGERELPKTLPEREFTRGCQGTTALDQERAVEPFPRSPATRSNRRLGEVVEHQPDSATANSSPAPHLPDNGRADRHRRDDNVEYIPYHARSSRTVTTGFIGMRRDRHICFCRSS